MAWIIRTINWHRRKIAALLAALGMFALVSHLFGATETSGQVVITTTTVAAGQPLDASDVDLVARETSAIPADALTDLDDVLGRSAAVALSPNTTLQPGLLVSGASPPSGRSLVPITVHDAQLRAILSPGLRMALVSSGADVPGMVTDDAVVHSVPDSSESSFVASGQAALVLVEVPAELAPEVSVLGQSGQLSFFLTG